MLSACFFFVYNALPWEYILRKCVFQFETKHETRKLTNDQNIITNERKTKISFWMKYAIDGDLLILLFQQLLEKTQCRVCQSVSNKNNKKLIWEKLFDETYCVITILRTIDFSNIFFNLVFLYFWIWTLFWKKTIRFIDQLDKNNFFCITFWWMKSIFVQKSFTFQKSFKVLKMCHIFRSSSFSYVIPKTLLLNI